MKSPLNLLRRFLPERAVSGSQRRQKLSYRPNFDCLEDRCLLSTLVVTDPGDTNGPNQLRTILSSPSLANGDRITFDKSSVSFILLDAFKGFIAIDKSVTIDGPSIEIGGHGGTTIFVNNAANTTIEGLELTKASNTGLTGEGGGSAERRRGSR